MTNVLSPWGDKTPPWQRPFCRGHAGKTSKARYLAMSRFGQCGGCGRTCDMGPILTMALRCTAKTAVPRAIQGALISNHQTANASAVPVVARGTCTVFDRVPKESK